VVLESPRGEEQGGRLGGETRDEPPEGVGGGIRRDADRTALAPRRRFRARSDGGREAARAPAEDEDGAVRNPAERRLEVTARRRGERPVPRPPRARARAARSFPSARGAP